MARTTTVDLAEPIVGHAGPITRIVLREPTARDYFSLGEPSVYARNGDGAIYSVENAEVIERYIERCIAEPQDSLLIGQMTLADAMRVKGAVLDFFTAARSPGSSSAPNS